MTWFEEYLKNNELVSAWFRGEESFAHLSLLQEALLIVGAKVQGKKHQVILKENDQQVLNLYEMILSIDPSIKVKHYLHETSLRVEAISQSDVLKEERLNTIYALLAQDYDVLITHASASVRRISKPDTFKEHILTLNEDDEINRDDLIKSLHNMGYQRVKYVDRPLCFSFRGGVFDVYSANYSHPIRIEFFDDLVESIRFFDVKTQRSIAPLTTATIIFAEEVLLTQEECKSITKNARDQIKDKETRDNMAIALDQLEQGIYDHTMYPLLAKWENSTSILEFVNLNDIYISPIESFTKELESYVLDSDLFISEQTSLHQLVKFNDLFIDIKPTLNNSISVYEFQGQRETYLLPWHQNRLTMNNSDDVLRWLERESTSKVKIITVTEDNKSSLHARLDHLGIEYKEQVNYPKKPGLYLFESSQVVGISFDDLEIDVYSAEEILNHKGKTFRYDNKFFEAENLERLQDLGTYDYVVHRQYGIGKYMGITTKNYDNIEKDFMRIMYKDGDELFVPLEKFHLVRKYMSSDANAVRLNKLGTDTWERNKAKVKEDVAQIADKLIHIYSQRLEETGFEFEKDNELQMQFEKEFPYPLTIDQEKAILEIKNDMESNKPMDRLLSGDVGFGKTEVAIRASFKAVISGKQVVFLCPTTILSSQHYQTFKERFVNYPVTIEVLNRFVSDKKQKEIIDRVKQGKVDILIGTHRVLSKDIVFKDLGFLVIDEEQRFGVEHKERIKEYRAMVDVLSLSATPIPRTLQMSLIGLRSLSQLNTPPQDRLPVMTYVIEKNKKTLHDVILKEIRRDGQVFYLYNNVNQIYTVANSISMEIEEAKVGVIHGQMDRHSIEDIMLEFINKNINVLVCTTIIETGIDIPNANTMIVDNAHKFGLSQLYQIKGRVGRSDRLAYAYFVVPQKKSLTEIATKRLQAIKEFSQLGSGYKIAMRDLSIRGAGEMLGANQSGFIDTVGMDLYVELLKEAIDQRKGIQKEEKKEDLTINSSGYLPDNFTFNDSEKLDFYQEIQSIETLKDYENYYQSIQDRYGQLPESVEMLLEKTRLELFLKDLRIEAFHEKYNHVELVFTQEYSDIIDGVHLFQLISEMSYDIEIKYIKQKIVIIIPNSNEWIKQMIQILEEVQVNDNET
ncbi:transcription-repair coupling factor [Erysipelothrix urinaevulpis]|uniref:transcription-repair coupling factor n=1 Tax=Erysipelothrix urinaevulpis TaxID=2683717 RepID=UPI0013580AE6|nr:transcription-repair coupling factor [Erysipelothrix urinaevulpis]